MSDDAILWLVLLVVGGAIAFRALLWRKVRAWGAQSWPICQGKMEFGTVIEHRTKYFSYYSAQMSYSYAAEGEYYSGFYKKVFFHESSAEKLIDQLKGRDTFVRHKRASPQVSTILREDQQSIWPLES